VRPAVLVQPLLVVALLATAFCGGKAVIDPRGAGGTGGSDGSGGSTATGDPNCLALCGHDTFACTSNSQTSGVLSYDEATATGCSWTFTAAGEAPIAATIDCEQYCMLEAGQCYILTWSVPGDPVASALVFATSSDVWGCEAASP